MKYNPWFKTTDLEPRPSEICEDRDVKRRSRCANPRKSSLRLVMTGTGALERLSDHNHNVFLKTKDSQFFLQTNQ